MSGDVVVFVARAAREEAKKREREQHHAMLANRGMFMGGGSGGGGGGGANGAAEGVGHVQPLGYGSYGESEERGIRQGGAETFRYVEMGERKTVT